MRWPTEMDWVQHLIRRNGGRPGFELERGPHGGWVNERGYEHLACPLCGNVAVWPPDVDVPCVPPGHRIVRGWGGRITGDVCPLRD